MMYFILVVISIIISVILLLLRLLGISILSPIKNNLYYFPTKDGFYQIPENVVDVFVTNEYGDRLHAWYYKGNSDKVVLFCHGNAGNLSHRGHIIKKFIEMKLSVLLFDYRGFGKSTGSTTPESTVDDAETFMEYLIKEHKILKNNIVPMGESIGSYPAAKLAQIHNLPKLIILAGFYSISKVISNIFMSPLNIICSTIAHGDLETGRYIENFNGETLILHSRSDKMIDFENAKMNKLCNSKAKLIEIKGGHNNPYFDWNIINNFINNTM